MYKKSKIIGILNITPDSFSDGGLCGNSNEIITKLQGLIAANADIIDIGAESTRPGATALTGEQEWRRLADILPQICEIAKSAGKLTSLDTRHAFTAKAAINCGIDWINDVSGVGSAAMQELLALWHGKIVIMHNLGIPADKNVTIAASKNAVREVKNWLTAKLDYLESIGIQKSRVIIDPGVGFGKTAAQSWLIIDNILEFKSFGVQLLVGHSRKSFLAARYGNNLTIEQLDAATAEISKILAENGVDYLRVHNVGLHRDLYNLSTLK